MDIRFVSCFHDVPEFSAKVLLVLVVSWMGWDGDTGGKVDCIAMTLFVPTFQ